MGVRYYFYTDDTQFCFEIIDMQGDKDKSVVLLLDIRGWIHKRRFKLTDGKTKIMIVRGMNQYIEIDNFGKSVVDGVTSVFVNSVRNMRVIFDEFQIL